jgi:hypothetical protein
MMKNLYNERYEAVPIGRLLPYEDNPRQITKEELENLAQSIESDPQFLIGNSLLVNHNTETDTYHVYVGNQRLAACKTLGYTELPCCVADNLPVEIIRNRVLRDNHHNGAWDLDKLYETYAIEELELLGKKFLQEVDFDKIMEELSAQDTDLDEGAHGARQEEGEGVVIKIEVIFETPDERQRFDELLAYLRHQLPDTETVSARLYRLADMVLDAPDVVGKMLEDAPYRQTLQKEASGGR